MITVLEICISIIIHFSDLLTLVDSLELRLRGITGVVHIYVMNGRSPSASACEFTQDTQNCLLIIFYRICSQGASLGDQKTPATRIILIKQHCRTSR